MTDRLGDDTAPLEIIRFLKVKEPHGFLSNFWPCEIRYDGRIWPTSEHLYQAMKHLGTSYVDDVHAAKTAWVAMKMGRDSDHPPREGWESIKDDVMRHVLMLKFSQSKELSDWLLTTGDAVLVEHGYHDRYWADGGNGSGKNMLGVCLMEVREVLRAAIEYDKAFAAAIYTDQPIMYVSPITAYLHDLSQRTGMKS